MMSSRERVVTALSRQIPDRVPWDVGSLSPALEEAFKTRTGAGDAREFFGVDVRSVSLSIPTGWGRIPKPDDLTDPDWPRKEARFRQYYSWLPERVTIDEWGRAYAPGDYYHFVKIHGPMGGFTTLAELEAYPWPDFAADFRIEHMRRRVREFHGRDLAVGAGLATTHFETAWQLRGYDQFFLDMVEFPEFTTALLDKITDLRQPAARAFAEADVDVLMLGDDVSMQTGMMMRVATWRQWFKPRLAAVIAAAREIKPDIHVWYHSDGNPEAIVPDLIEIGVNVLNPVQPECVDPAKLKRLYGDRLAFWGSIGIQHTMPFGSPDDVRREVKERMETVGAGGGLLLAPTHMLEPEVPLENVFALAEAIQTYGRYA
ncbi:MAG: hypothetical protein HYY04_06195 [Chloroflexi bacterium]|nr:hypothetical protein [Chloroflexota bacterium]